MEVMFTCRKEDQHSVAAFKSIDSCIYFSSNTESCGGFSCLKLKNQWGFQAESCKQDPLLPTFLIHRWEMLSFFFFLSTILPYINLMEKSWDCGCFWLHPWGPKRLFPGNKHIHPPLHEGRWPKSLECSTFQEHFTYEHQTSQLFLPLSP